jgi:flagellar basal-body rod protein FlgF
MIQALHLTAQGMTPLMQKQDQIANNLANINTAGYKQSNLFVRSYNRYLESINETKEKHTGPFIEPYGSYPANYPMEPFVERRIEVDDVYIDYSEGPAQRTDGPLDLMIRGSGFFTVMTMNGVEYTRNGHFSLNPDGFLVASDGAKVMSEKGFVRVDTQNPVQITDTGEVIQDGEVKDVLRIADFRKPYRFLREGNGYFRPELPDNPVVESPGFAIKQGFLEGSNVNVVKSMADMISAFRNFEADQKALMAQDETLQKSVNDVGRLN